MSELLEPPVLTHSVVRPRGDAGEWYRPGNSIIEFHRSGAKTRILIGGRGCLAAGVPLYDPEDGTTETIGERAASGRRLHVLAMTPAGIQSVPVEPPFLKGVARLWRVVLENGKEIRCASEHRFLTPGGWRRISQLSDRQTVAFSDNPVPTKGGIFLSEFWPSAPHWWKIIRDWKEGCWPGLRRYGARLLPQSAASRVFSPLPGGVFERILRSLLLDAPVSRLEGSRLYLSSFLRSTWGWLSPFLLCSAVGARAGFSQAFGGYRDVPSPCGQLHRDQTHIFGVILTNQIVFVPRS